MLSDSEIEFIDSSIFTGTPFAVVALPGEKHPILFGSDGVGSSGASIRIVPWLGKFNAGVTNLQESRLLTMQLNSRSTSREEYLRGVGNVIKSCRARNGKTVYSRVVCGAIPADRSSWGRIADRLFQTFPDTYRFVFYTHATLGWLGTSPELLLDFDKQTGNFSTVSLAGTRLHAETGVWDCKNIDENRFVSEFIATRLSAAKAKAVDVGPLTTVRYGDIDHLQRRITGTTVPTHIPALLDAISPTPALCGYPVEDAISDLSAWEPHNRNCYGGYVALDLPSRFVAFVNLRSLQFCGNSYCVYSGGGITPLSVAADEWSETEAKAARLLYILHE